MTLKKFRKPMTAFVLFSLLLHVSVWLFYQFKKGDQPTPTKEVVEIEYRGEEPAELTPPEEQNEDVQRVKREERDQIVEQQKRLNDEKDENTKFLSAFDQVVQKQTRAQENGAFNNTAKGGQIDEGVKDGEKKEEMETERREAQDMEADETPGELPSLKSLIPKFALTPGPKGPKMDENGEVSQTDDHIKNVETGMQTLLSSREFVYYAYYNRIKDGLRQHWEPNVREKVKIIYRQGRTIASAKDRVTQLLVTLNPEGELVKVEVLTQSGVMDLDSAAVEAFRQAAPFPNPPKGMVEADGTIKIRWDFVLEA